MTRIAEFRSSCCDCDDPVLPGDEIESTKHGWAHARCPSDVETLGTPCKRCRLHHVGECL